MECQIERLGRASLYLLMKHRNGDCGQRMTLRGCFRYLNDQRTCGLQEIAKRIAAIEAAGVEEPRDEEPKAMYAGGLMDLARRYR